MTAIALSPHTIAQGPVIARHGDGTVTIDAGGKPVTGTPIERIVK